jgi:predicted flap endonuclease-1-like 5' DNA nuclease
MNAQAIAELQGLGPKSEAMLAAVGIKTVAQLRRLGSVRA